MSPRDELESRVVAMLLGEANDFEKIELEAILDKDVSLQTFRDEMACSIDVVSEATVSLGPAGGAGAPKLSPSRRQEIEQAWSGGATSAKTTSVIGTITQMHPLASLAVAAGIGLATGTVLVNLNDDDGHFSSSVATSAEASAQDIPDVPSRRNVFDMPEGVASTSPQGQEQNDSLVDGKDLAADKELLENELSNLAKKEPVLGSVDGANLGDHHLDLDRRGEKFRFDTEDIETSESEPISEESDPKVFDLGPPNAPAVARDGPAVPNGFPLTPVPNQPSLLVNGSGGEGNVPPGQVVASLGNSPVPGVPGLGVKPVVTKQSQEKRDPPAKHVTVATYKGLQFQLCKGEAASCPKDCGDSGEFATFEIVKYLEYDQSAKSGSSKQTSHLIQVRNFYRKPVGDLDVRKTVTELKEGDHVMLAWNHDYVTSKGVSAPDRPLKELRRLTEEEEKQYFPR